MASSSSLTAPNAVIKLAAACIARALEQRNDFAVVGGAAVALLGGERITTDVDVVIANANALRESRTTLRDADDFEVERRTLHTFFAVGEERTPVDLLCPGSTFLDSFNPTTDVMSVTYAGRSVPILHPLKILNNKCRSLLGRATQGKKNSDATDIIYLVWWLASNPSAFSWDNLPNCPAEFVAAFIAEYGGQEYWSKLPARLVATSTS